MESEPKIEAVTVPLHPDLVAALERIQARLDALPEPLRAWVQAEIVAEERRLIFGDTEE